MSLLTVPAASSRVRLQTRAACRRERPVSGWRARVGRRPIARKICYGGAPAEKALWEQVMHSLYPDECGLAEPVPCVAASASSASPSQIRDAELIDRARRALSELAAAKGARERSEAWRNLSENIWLTCSTCGFEWGPEAKTESCPRCHWRRLEVEEELAQQMDPDLRQDYPLQQLQQIDAVRRLAQVKNELAQLRRDFPLQPAPPAAQPDEPY